MVDLTLCNSSRSQIKEKNNKFNRCKKKSCDKTECPLMIKINEQNKQPSLKNLKYLKKKTVPYKIVKH